MSNNTLENIALEIGKALQPLTEATASPIKFRGLLLRLGWDEEAIPAPIEALAGDLIQLSEVVQQIANGSTDEELIKTLIASVESVIRNIIALEAAPFSSALLAENFNEEFPIRLIEYLLTEYLTINQERIGFLLKAFGILRNVYIPATATRPGYIQKRIIFSDLPSLFSDPVLLFENAYGWRTDNLDIEAVYGSFKELLIALKIPANLYSLDTNLVARLENLPVIEGDPIRWALKIPIFSQGSPTGAIGAGFSLLALRGDGTTLPGLALLPYLSGTLSEEFPIKENFSEYG